MTEPRQLGSGVVVISFNVDDELDVDEEMDVVELVSMEELE